MFATLNVRGTLLWILLSGEYWTGRVDHYLEESDVASYCNVVAGCDRLFVLL